MKKHIEIEGMSCEHCVKAVKNVLEELGGTDITVDLSGGFAEAEISADDNKIIEAIAEEEFEVVKIENIEQKRAYLMYALFNLLWFYASALKFLSLSAFERTDTELKLIAAAAIIGLRSGPPKM